MARYVSTVSEVGLIADVPKGRITVTFLRDPRTRCITLRADQVTLFAATIAELVAVGVLTPADAP